MVLVLAAAAANSETASGLVPPTVDQTAGRPWLSARTIVSSETAGFGCLMARPARSGATADHLQGVRGEGTPFGRNLAGGGSIPDPGSCLITVVGGWRADGSPGRGAISVND